MAAGAYKGLTIKIGADTTRLSSALRGADSAIHKTQVQLNNLNKASKLDPGNSNVMAAQMGALSTQAMNAAREIAVLKQGIDKLGDQPLLGGDGSIRNVRQLADSTTNITLAARDAERAFDDADKKLNNLYRDIIRQNPDVKLAELRKLTNEGHFNEGVLKSLVGDNRISKEQADKVKDLKKEWVEARRSLDDYANVEKLGDLTNKLTIQEASLRALGTQLATTARSMSDFDVYSTKAFSGLGAKLSPVNSQLALISSASESISARLRSLGSSMSLNYGGMDVAAEKTDALNNAIEAAELKAGLLEQRLRAYESVGVDKLANDMGNVAVEVEASESAFAETYAELQRLRDGGDTSSDAFKRLEAAVTQAQARMDTAHACQQYQNLKKQLHEARSEAVELALKMTDLRAPSSAATSGDMRKLSVGIEFVDSALKSAERDANSLDAALKLNPDNVAVVSEKTRLLAEASKLAGKETADLKEKLSKYDLSAISEATDSTKTAAEQILDAGENFDKANEKIRKTEESIAKMHAMADSFKLDGVTSGNVTNAETFENEVARLNEQLAKEKAAAEEASRALDLSKQRAEVEQLQTDIVKSAAAEERLAAQSRALSYINATPRFDVSFGEQMRNAFNEISSGRGVESAMGEISNRLKDVEASADEAYDHFSRLDSALQVDPGNMDVAVQRATALGEAMSSTDRQIENLKSAMSSIPVTMIDRLAIESGTVGEKVAESSRRFDEASSRAEGYQSTINGLQAELSKLEQQSVISEQDAQNIENLKAQIDLLTKSMQSFAAEDEKAFNDMNKAVATQTYSEMEVKLTELNGRAKELGDTLGGLKVPSNISEGLKPVDDQLNLVSTGLDTASSRFSKLNQASQIKPYSLSIAVEKVRALREATETARQKAELLKSKIDAYKADGIDRIARGVKDAGAAFEKAQANVNRLESELAKEVATNGRASEKARELARELANARQAANTAAAVNEYKNLEVELRNVQTTSKQMKDSMKSDLGEVGTAAFMASQQLAQMAQQAWGKISQSSNEVDAAYRNLRKTFNAEEGDYQKLYDAAMQYSQSHVTSADTMLEMEATAAQLGVGMEGGAEAIQAFADAAANLDVATNIDADTIALQMGQIMAVMGDVDYKNIDKFGDALVRLGNNMPTQESNIMQITQRLSAVGNVAGFSTPQLLGWSAAVASTGQRSEAAATGLANLITGISVAVDDFDKGGDSLDKFAKVAGVSAEQFAKDWREGPSEALQGLIEKLGDSETLFSDLAGMEITSVRQTQTLAALSQTVGKLNDATTMASDAFNGLPDKFGDAGDAAREAEKKAEGFSGSFAKLQNSIQVLSASFGPAFVDILDMVADKVQWLTTVVGGWSDEFKQKVILAAGSFVAFSAIGTIIGPLAKSLFDFGKGAIGFVITQIAAMRDAFANMSLGGGIMNLTSTGGKLGGLVTKLTSLSTWAGLAAGALAALGVALAVKFAAKAIKAKLETDRFNKALDESRNATKNLYGELMTGSDKVSEFGRSWQEAKVDMNDFMTAMEEHNKIQADTREEATESIGMLEKYKSVIDNAAGAGKNYDGSLAELKWAVEGLNEMLGTNYDYNEILKGSYNDAEGAAHSYREEIDKLIEAKEREIRINAMSDLYAEEYKNLEKNKKALKDARDARREFTQEYIKEHEGDTTRDSWTGEVRQKTRNELVSDAHATDTWQDLNNTVGEVTKETNASADALKYYDGALQSLLNEGRYAEEGFRGIREGIMLDSPTMMEAINNSSMFGDSIEEVGGKVKELAQKLMDAKVGTEEFAEMANEHPDVFADMVEQADGNMDKLVELISEWNMSELEDKYAGFTYDETGFVNAKGDRIDWNGTDWEFKAAEVDVDTKQVDEAEKKKEKLKGDVTFGIDVKDGGASRVLDDLSNTKLNAVTMKFVAEDGGVMSMYDMLQSLTGATITSNFDANTDGLDKALDEVNAAQGKDVNINIGVGNLDGVETANEVIATIPSSVMSTVSVQTPGMEAATGRIGALNTASSAMRDEIHVYQANGNAATSISPSNMIRAVTSAAGSLTSKAVAYSASGNIITGNVASKIQAVVDVANRLVSKSVDIVTNIVTNTINNKVGGSATGTYIDPNKMPKHAAGIFTRPTLTNIGWVGEDGAELYSGNSLVPLTNRKYSMPYIDDISSAVAKKLGAQSVGIDYELLGRSVATALAGMSVTIDGQALVGEIATQVERTSRFYAG